MGYNYKVNHLSVGQDKDWEKTGRTAQNTPDQ